MEELTPKEAQVFVEYVGHEKADKLFKSINQYTELVEDLKTPTGKLLVGFLYQHRDELVEKLQKQLYGNKPVDESLRIELKLTASLLNALHGVLRERESKIFKIKKKVKEYMKDMGWS